MRQRHWRRRVIALTIVPFAIAFGVSPTGSAHPGCFQKGGYNPPPCTTSAPVADDSQAPSENQNPAGSSSTGQSTTGQGANPPPDSGVIACQNQNAMSTSLGLQPITCRATQGANTPPDSGVTACQNQSAMAVAIGLQPTTCRTTQGANTPPDSGVTACQNQNAMSTSLGLQPAVCPPSRGG